VHGTLATWLDRDDDLTDLSVFGSGLVDPEESAEILETLRVVSRLRRKKAANNSAEALTAPLDAQNLGDISREKVKSRTKQNKFFVLILNVF
jgi:hypothetical protein